MYVQIVTLEVSDSIAVWPQDMWALPPGSVSLLDCKDQWIDMRSRPPDDPTHAAVFIAYRCHMLSPDVNFPWSRIGFFFHTTGTVPCNVRLPAPVLPVISSLDPENTPEYSQILYMYGNHCPALFCTLASILKRFHHGVSPWPHFERSTPQPHRRPHICHAMLRSSLLHNKVS